MKSKTRWSAQLMGVLLCALGLKLYYSAASPDELRWILAPTAWLVETLSGRTFSFEAHAGYMSSDHTFLIAASCAGVNFLITSFLMLSIRHLWQQKFEHLSWRFLPITALAAYATTLAANTTRICLALRTQGLRTEISLLTANQIHRAEGILVYFGFLLVLYLATGKQKLEKRVLIFPLLIYYVTTLGVPLLNGAYKQGLEFWEHSAFVMGIPLLVLGAIMSGNLISRLCFSSLRLHEWRKSV